MPRDCATYLKLFTVRRSALLLIALALTSCTAPPAPSRPAEAGVVRLQGLLEHPVSLRAADLNSRSQQHQQAAFGSHEGAQNHSYQGVSLADVLQQCGIESEPKNAGGELDRYLVATGKDGYQAVFSLGEIRFGVGDKKSLVATRLDTNASDMGVFYTTAPGDAKGGRYVADLVSLDVRAPSPAGDSSQVPLGSLQLSGALNEPMTLDAAALASTQQGGQQAGTLEGVFDGAGTSLWLLLNKAGLQLEPGRKNPLLSMFAVAQGRDGYRVIFSLAELSPDFGNKPVLVKVARQAPGDLARAADIRLVVPQDADHSRWVRQLVSLTVESAKPVGVGVPSR